MFLKEVNCFEFKAVAARRVMLLTLL